MSQSNTMPITNNVTLSRFVNGFDTEPETLMDYDSPDMLNIYHMEMSVKSDTAGGGAFVRPHLKDKMHSSNVLKFHDIVDCNMIMLLWMRYVNLHSRHASAIDLPLLVVSCLASVSYVLKIFRRRVSPVYHDRFRWAYFISGLYIMISEAFYQFYVGGPDVLSHNPLINATAGDVSFPYVLQEFTNTSALAP